MRISKYKCITLCGEHGSCVALKKILKNTTSYPSGQLKQFVGLSSKHLSNSGIYRWRNWLGMKSNVILTSSLSDLSSLCPPLFLWGGHTAVLWVLMSVQMSSHPSHKLLQWQVLMTFFCPLSISWQHLRDSILWFPRFLRNHILTVRLKVERARRTHWSRSDLLWNQGHTDTCTGWPSQNTGRRWGRDCCHIHRCLHALNKWEKAH